MSQVIPTLSKKALTFKKCRGNLRAGASGPAGPVLAGPILRGESGRVHIAAACRRHATLY